MFTIFVSASREPPIWVSQIRSYHLAKQKCRTVSFSSISSQWANLRSSKQSWMEYETSNIIFSSSPESYNLFENNCNHFTDEVAQFLTGKGIPHEIVNLPNEVLCT